MTTIDEGILADAKVAARQRLVPETVSIPVNGIALPSELVIPAGARGLVLSLFTDHRIRENPRTALVARHLERSGLATLFVPLVPSDDGHHDTPNRDRGDDPTLPARRLLQATRWAMRDPRTRHLGMGYLGTGRTASACLQVASQLGYVAQAVVLYGGLLEATDELLPRVNAPTLLIVGEWDESLIQLSRRAFDRMVCNKELTVVPQAGHNFEEKGALEHVAMLTSDWFHTHLQPIQMT